MVSSIISVIVKLYFHNLKFKDKNIKSPYKLLDREVSDWATGMELEYGIRGYSLT